METPSDRCEFAVKFFLDREAFLTEAALYAACLPAIRNTASPAVLAQVDAAFGSDLKLQPSGSGSKVRKWKFLPPVSMVCDGGTKGMVDPKGRPLPPCIVTEYGQSLQEWLDRRRADNFSALAVSYCCLTESAALAAGSTITFAYMAKKCLLGVVQLLALQLCKCIAAECSCSRSAF